MSTGHSLTSIALPVPELPVTDFERAQRHYRDALGLRDWLDGNRFYPIMTGHRPLERGDRWPI